MAIKKQAVNPVKPVVKLHKPEIKNNPIKFGDNCSRLLKSR
jgi:hypothetical protein